MAAESGKMNLFSSVALIVGACIGSAIFSISGITVFYAGPSAILSWIIAALIYSGYGLVVVGLARRFPRSGGIFLFPKRTIGGKAGSFWGFVSGWGYVVSNIIAIAFSAICMGAYLHAGFPSLNSGVIVSIVACVVSLAVLLCGGKASQRLQNLLVALLVCTMAIYCCTALFGGAMDFSAFGNFFTSGSKGTFGFAGAVPLAMVAYGGCVAIAFMAEDVQNASRTIPRALVIGLGVVSVLYALTVFSIVGTLPQAALAGKPELRLVPLFASVTDGSLSVYPWLTKVISVCVSVALLTTIIALLRVNSRAVQAMSAEGLLPEFLFKENKAGVPWPALCVMTLLAVALCLFHKYTEQFISLGAVLNVASMAITCVSLAICKRGKKIMLPVSVVTVFLLCYIPEILSSGSGLWIFTAAVYLLGLVVYLVCSRVCKPRVSGFVIHGKGKGKLYGMPTANLRPYKGEALPEYGVWATKVVTGGREFKALTNVGLRPSVDDSKEPTIETMIVDFQGEIYGEEMTVIFCKYIRPTRKFADLAELRTQIEKDLLVF